MLRLALSSTYSQIIDKPNGLAVVPFLDVRPWWERLLRKRARPREGFRGHRFGGHWGDRIAWTFPYSSFHGFGRVCGWKRELPRVGDLLYVRMESGRLYALLFTEVEPCGDPKDMFFGVVVGFGDAYEVNPSPTA